MMRPLEEVGAWEKYEQTDLTKGTFPKGSAWGPVGKVGVERTKNKDYRLVQELIDLVLAPIKKESSIGPFP